MDKQELRIQQLINQSNYYKFEYQLLMTEFIAATTLALTVLVTMMLSTNDLTIRAWIGVLLSLIVAISLKHYYAHSNRIKGQISKLSKEIHLLYSKVLK